MGEEWQPRQRIKVCVWWKQEQRVWHSCKSFHPHKTSEGISWVFQSTFLVLQTGSKLKCTERTYKSMKSVTEIMRPRTWLCLACNRMKTAFYQDGKWNSRRTLSVTEMCWPCWTPFFSQQHFQWDTDSSTPKSCAEPYADNSRHPVQASGGSLSN